jgi:hypothetical protein
MSVNETLTPSKVAALANAVQTLYQQPINDNISLTGTTAATTNTYLDFGYNVITNASETAYACRLPNPPIKGRSTVIVNNSGFPIVVYPSVTGGSINGVVDAGITVPADGSAYSFVCYENPLPGGWGSVGIPMTSTSTNTVQGNAAFQSNTTGTHNTAIGYFALNKNTTGSANVALGSESLKNNTTSEFNTAVGYQALKANTTGLYNTALGATSLLLNTVGAQNTAIGAFNLTANINGSFNIALGSTNLTTNSSGSGNIAIGFNCLRDFSNTSHNIAIGYEVLKSSSGTSNIGIGYQSLYDNTTGNYNTAIGISTYSGNFSGSVILGKDAAATANNQFVVGSSGTNAGTVTTETITPNRTWTVRINGVNYKIPMLQV